MATKSFTVNGHVFEVRARNAAIGAEASRNVAKLGVKVNKDSAPHEDLLLSAELGRLLLVKWTKPDGSEPLAGLSPAKAREYLQEHDGALLAILELSGKLAKEENAEFELDSGN